MAKNLNAANIGKVAKDIEAMLVKQLGNDPTLKYQIEQVASDFVIMRQIRKELLALPTVMISEDGSQGQVKTKVHPLSAEYREYGRRVQDGLDKLRMNLKSKQEKSTTPDALTQWMSKNE